MAKAEPDRPVLIAGPTASGKSSLALSIAERFGGCIINADALQVYRDWNILSARPSADDLGRAEHHLYGHVPFETAYSTGAWLRDIRPFLTERVRPIIVGGTGLNFSALTEGLTEIPPIPEDVRDRGNQLRANETRRMLEELESRDPQSAAKIDRNNPMRVQRAWEVLTATGKGFATWHSETPPPDIRISDAVPIVLDAPVEWLSPRIGLRFEMMMEAGALDEVKAVQPFFDPTLPAARAIGAAELIAHLEGKLPISEAVGLAKIATRQYAKRQRTWFRNRLKSWSRVSAVNL